jgi:cytochrome c-type biogenesis protein CcmH/NrfF
LIQSLLNTFLLPFWLVAVSIAAPPVPAVQQATQRAEQPVIREVEVEDPELEAQVREIAAKLRCPTCRALSVLDSPAGMAQEMRALIREQLKAGKTREEITAYFVARYGEWILLKPKAEGFNWTVWLLPIFIVAGGLFFVFLTARRWVQQGRAQAVLLEGQGGVRNDGPE